MSYQPIAPPRFANPGTAGAGNDFEIQQQQRTIDAICKQLGLINNQPQPANPGSVAGYIEASMPFQGASFKVAIVRLVGMNGTVTYAFPTPFNKGVGVIELSQGGIPDADITSLTGLAIGITTITPTDGLVVIIGN